MDPFIHYLEPLPKSLRAGADNRSSLCYVKAAGFIAAIERKHRGGRSGAIRLFHIQGYRTHMFLF